MVFVFHPTHLAYRSRSSIRVPMSSIRLMMPSDLQVHDVGRGGSGEKHIHHILHRLKARLHLLKKVLHEHSQVLMLIVRNRDRGIRHVSLSLTLLKDDSALGASATTT